MQDGKTTAVSVASRGSSQPPLTSCVCGVGRQSLLPIAALQGCQCLTLRLCQLLGDICSRVLPDSSSHWAVRYHTQQGSQGALNHWWCR